MTTIALVLAAVSALIALICFAALIEMYKSLDEIQKYVEYGRSIVSPSLLLVEVW